MLKTIVKAQQGLEEEFDFVSKQKANLEADKELAIQEAIAEVERRYQVKSEKLDFLFAQVSETEEVEVPDEEVVEAVAEEPIQ